MNNTEKGRRGEDIAAAYLMRSGFEIICRNFRHGKAELDIIAKDDDTTVFVEVKARAGEGFGSGAEAVTKRKISMLISGAMAFCYKNKLFDSKLRFDVVEVDLKKMCVTSHVRDAFDIMQ